MTELFNRIQKCNLNKIIKSRLNKDGFALVDAIVAFTLLSLAIVLLLGFMSTTIRTAPLIESDAEDQQATMIALSQAIAKTSSVHELNINLVSYVPMRSLTEPNTFKLYNNYDSSNKTMFNPDGDMYELLSKNIIPSTSMMVAVHPSSNQWIQTVKTAKLKGAVFSFEPVNNILSDNLSPSIAGFFNLYREERQRDRLKQIDTLNYPTSYLESEMMIYENTIK